MLQLTDEIWQAIDRVILERFADKVEAVEIDTVEGEVGDEVLFIRVVMSPDTTSRDFAGRFFGLTGRVRNVLGDEMRDVFPIIRPVGAHA